MFWPLKDLNKGRQETVWKLQRNGIAVPNIQNFWKNTSKQITLQIKGKLAEELYAFKEEGRLQV
jgi:hypothetical protein